MPRKRLSKVGSSMGASWAILQKMKKSAPSWRRSNRLLSGSGKVTPPRRRIRTLETLGAKARPVLSRPKALKERSVVLRRFAAGGVVGWGGGGGPGGGGGLGLSPERGL